MKDLSSSTGSFPFTEKVGVGPDPSRGVTRRRGVRLVDQGPSGRSWRICPCPRGNSNLIEGGQLSVIISKVCPPNLSLASKAKRREVQRVARKEPTGPSKQRRFVTGAGQTGAAHNISDILLLGFKFPERRGGQSDREEGESST